MTITSYEIAQQTGLTHTEVGHIITRFEARRIAAGGQPLEQRQTKGRRNGRPMTVSVLTDADMRFLSACTHSRLWVRLYADHPEWRPETLSPADMKKRRAKARAKTASREKAYRRVLAQSRAETRAARLAREKADREAERTRRQAEREAERRRKAAERLTPEWQAREAERRRIALRNLELSNERRRREKREYERAREAAREESELEAEGLYTFSMAAQRIGLPAGVSLSTLLRERRIIWSSGGGDTHLLPPYAGRGYDARATIWIGRRWVPTPVSVMVWTEAGLRFLKSLLCEGL